MRGLTWCELYLLHQSDLVHIWLYDMVLNHAQANHDKAVAVLGKS